MDKLIFLSVLLLFFIKIQGNHDTRIYQMKNDIFLGEISNYNLPALFSNTTNTKFENYIDSTISYQIQGNAPCEIIQSWFDLNREFIFHDTKEIKDFSIFENTIYYLTSEGIKKADLTIDSFNKPIISSSKFIFEFTKPNIYYTFIDTASFNQNQDIIIFLKNSSFISYGIYSPQNDEFSEIKILCKTYDITDDIKISYYDNFLFVPAKRNGLFVFKYSKQTKNILFKEALFNGTQDGNYADVRDVAILEKSNEFKIFLLIADYNKGLIEIEFNLINSENIYIITIEEFIKITGIFSPDFGRTSEIFVILENGISSKLVFMNYSADSGYLQFEFQDSMILDGIIRYGDSNNKFISLILRNSLMVFENNDIPEINYISLPGVTHAKFASKFLLLFAKYNEISIDKILFYPASINCLSRRKFANYNFRLISQNITCELLAKSELEKQQNCYQILNFTLSVKEFPEKINFIEQNYIYLIIGGIIFTALLILICFCRSYRKMSAKLQEYEQIVTARDVLPNSKDMPTLAPTIPKNSENP